MEPSYFTPSELRSASFRAWVAELYQRTPKFLGTMAAIPHEGSWYVPASTNDDHVLVRRNDEAITYVNSCGHLRLKIRPTGKIFGGEAYPRQGRMDDRELKAKVIVCPWHRRAHRVDSGEFIAKSGEVKECRSLRKVETVRRGDLIFEAADGSLPTFEGLTASSTFAALGIKPLELPKPFVLYKTCVYDEKMDAATGGANFEEDAHVRWTHENTFAHVYDMRTLTIEVYDLASAAQFVGWSKEGAANPSEKYKRLRELILKRTCGKDPAFGVIWYRMGPFTTGERFSVGTSPDDHIAVISSFVPKPDGIGSMNIVEYYVPPQLAEDVEFMEAFFAAYDETAFEDRELCLAAEEGYDAMIRAGHGSDPVIASGADEERCLQNYYQYLRMLQLRYPVNSVRPVPELAVA
jgi:nitrite reductase/ring-hydroxylating ferredoxin subunit